MQALEVLLDARLERVAVGHGVHAVVLAAVLRLAAVRPARRWSRAACACARRRPGDGVLLLLLLLTDGHVARVDGEEARLLAEEVGRRGREDEVVEVGALDEELGGELGQRQVGFALGVGVCCVLLGACSRQRRPLWGRARAVGGRGG